MARKYSRVETKDFYADILLRIEPKDFAKPESFSRGGKPDLTFATVLNSIFSEKFKKNQLHQIIFELRGKWANTTNQNTIAKVASAMVYLKHYEYFHSNPIPESVRTRLEDTINSIKYTNKQPKKPKSKQKPRTKGDEITQKLRNMTPEQMFQWEEELGVPKEIIDKHKKLNAGLLRMNVGNVIRHLTRNK